MIFVLLILLNIFMKSISLKYVHFSPPCTNAFWTEIMLLD